ncbi:tetratricopeptide repeat protein 22 isoform X2 [Callorhinchus milii]|uniref:tetratricopeptide repeat protein 22 isoform X2 n=1 Tax=Callorhinchus milii TaxID=7868 RepID=UPI001C3F6673|nr:tetratricopeptide repeat protein 22 isoform X2 [Callorhinchus milii]
MDGDSERDIEALMQEMDYIPGHFHLELNLNFEPREPERQRRRDTELKRESLRLEAGGCGSGCGWGGSGGGEQRHAVGNLLGLLAFSLDEYQVAQKIFSDICREEPGNLNAWANLGYVYDRLDREPEAAECVERVSGLVARGRGRGSGPAARCLAEHAFANAFDVGLHREEEHRQRLSTAVRLYDRALVYGHGQITPEEKRSWYLTMATMLIRLDGILINEDVPEHERLPSFNRSLLLLREVLKSNNTQYKALAWCYLGMMLERKDSFSITPMAVHNCGYSATDPLDCFGQAIETAKMDPFILNRLAKIFHFLGKQEMAIGICNMALNILPDPGMNWQAYCTRAKINIKLYIQGLERIKMGQGGVPDRNLLTNAKTDLEHVLPACPCLKTYLDMGQVCYYMGVDAVEELQLVDENALNSALTCFAKAMEYDLGDTLPEIQFMRGKCLQVKGEEHNAVECFKQAIELDDEGSQYSESFRCLLEMLLSLFSQGNGNMETVIDEVEVWVKKAQAKYRMDKVKQELRTVCQKHTPQILELSKAMITAGKLQLVKLLFESVKES